MVKRFGSKNRAGTGSIEEDKGATTNTEKWAGAIASQMLNKDKVKDVIVKTIPIDFIKADQDNPRKLAIDLNLIKTIVGKHPIGQFIKNEQNPQISLNKQFLFAIFHACQCLIFEHNFIILLYTVFWRSRNSSVV